jgi:hypothetical protein
MEPISENNKQIAQSTLNEIRNIPKVSEVTYQGSNINHEKGTVDIYLNSSRESRHPDEYGDRGKKAERIADFYHDQVNTFVNKLKKLGYSVNIQAK